MLSRCSGLASIIRTSIARTGMSLAYCFTTSWVTTALAREASLFFVFIGHTVLHTPIRPAITIVIYFDDLFPCFLVETPVHWRCREGCMHLSCSRFSQCSRFREQPSALPTPPVYRVVNPIARKKRGSFDPLRTSAHLQDSSRFPIPLVLFHPFDDPQPDDCVLQVFQRRFDLPNGFLTIFVDFLRVNPLKG